MPQITIEICLTSTDISYMIYRNTKKVDISQPCENSILHDIFTVTRPIVAALTAAVFSIIRSMTQSITYFLLRIISQSTLTRRYAL